MSSATVALAPVTIAGTDIRYAQGIKAGSWISLGGHEASDFVTGLAAPVRGLPHFPLHGAPKHRREGDFILRRFKEILLTAGSDLKHGVRLDQYYPTWKAVDPYHLARRANFGDYIPPSTSILMEELVTLGANINASLLAVVPGPGCEIKRVATSKKVESPFFSGFAPAVTCGDFVFVAGQMANAADWSLDPAAHVPDQALWAGFEIRKQADFIIRERIFPALELAGASPASVVKAQAYLTSVEDVPHFMDVWNQHFGTRSCALSVVPCSGLAIRGGILEINALALIDAGKTKKEIISATLPETMSYGAPAVRAGDLLLLSGLMAVNDDGYPPGVVADDGLPYFGRSARAQMNFILDHAERVCRAAGAKLENIMRVHQFHADLAEFPATYAAWQAALPGQAIPFAAIRVPKPMPAPAATFIADLWVYAP